MSKVVHSMQQPYYYRCAHCGGSLPPLLFYTSSINLKGPTIESLTEEGQTDVDEEIVIKYETNCF